jgi:TadE-like protein
MTRNPRKGQSLVETALILAAFLGLLLGMISIGGALFARQTLSDRVQQAARWGAVNTYDPAAIRNVVLFGTATPEPTERAFLGLDASAVEVGNPGCPGPQCRVSVAIPSQGVHCVQPVESAPTGDVPAKP